MSTKERKSRVQVPLWWLEIALPKLDSPDTNLADVARVASDHAGRKKAWDSSAISKFKTGEGRTVALTNGISHALGIEQPFFTAPTEIAAKQMALIIQADEDGRRGQAHKTTIDQALPVMDGVADEAIRHGLVDADVRRGVVSSDNGDQSGRGVRARRSRRGRS